MVRAERICLEPIEHSFEHLGWNTRPVIGHRESKRIGTPFGRIDWTSLGSLTFESPDHDAFPCLDLCYEAGRRGETAPAWLNAANEVAVAAFLAGRIRWISIPDVLLEALSRHDGGTADSVEAVIDADRRARAVAETVIAERFST